MSKIHVNQKIQKVLVRDYVLTKNKHKRIIQPKCFFCLLPATRVAEGVTVQEIPFRYIVCEPCGEIFNKTEWPERSALNRKSEEIKQQKAVDLTNQQSTQSTTKSQEDAMGAKGKKKQAKKSFSGFVKERLSEGCTLIELIASAKKSFSQVKAQKVEYNCKWYVNKFTKDKIITVKEGGVIKLKYLFSPF
jgi:hypothetical protein